MVGWFAGEVAVPNPVPGDWIERGAHCLHHWYVARIAGAAFVVVVGFDLARMIGTRRKQMLATYARTPSSGEQRRH